MEQKKEIGTVEELVDSRRWCLRQIMWRAGSNTPGHYQL